MTCCSPTTHLIILTTFKLRKIWVISQIILHFAFIKLNFIQIFFLKISTFYISCLFSIIFELNISNIYRKSRNPKKRFFKKILFLSLTTNLECSRFNLDLSDKSGGNLEIWLSSRMGFNFHINCNTFVFIQRSHKKSEIKFKIFSPILYFNKKFQEMVNRNEFYKWYSHLTHFWEKWWST